MIHFEYSLLQLIPWYISVVPNSLLRSLFQIRGAALTLNLKWSAMALSKIETLDL